MNKPHAIRALLCAAGLGLIGNPAAAKPLNIVLLYVDDIGYGDLSCYNPDSKIITPHLDQLAAEGLRFTDAHCSSGICTPSRYALLTGRSHWRDFHGIDRGFDPPFIRPGQLTMQKMLQESGYHTACIGKWHLGWDWSSIRKPDAEPGSVNHEDYVWTKAFRGGPVDHHFDYYFGDNVINFPPYAWIENDRLLSHPDMTLSRHGRGVTTITELERRQYTKESHWGLRQGPATSDWDFFEVLPTLTEKAVEYVLSRKGNDEPFFLYYPFTSPHIPVVPSDEYDATSEAGAYGDFVVQTDADCGRIIAALKEAGHYDNTIIIFTGDNGAEICAYLRDEKFDHWSSHPFRGLKRDIYEGGHRMPTILRWPGVTEPGTTTDALFSQTDLIGTFASHLGYELPDDSAEDSFDFYPYLKGKVEDAPRVTMVHNTFPRAYAIRHHEWVLINARSGSQRGEPEEWLEKHGYPASDDHPVGLYNLAEDIGQRNNLAEKHPEKVTELQELLQEIRDGEHTSPRLAE